MSQTLVNFWLDCALAVTFVLLCWVSAVLQFLFPALAALARLFASVYPEPGQ